MLARDRALYGQKASYVMTTWLYLRALGVVSFIAFVSMWLQADGLLMSDGLLPAEDMLKRLGDRALERDWSPWALFQLAPSVFWLGSSDTLLRLALGTGCIASLFICLNLFTGPAIFTAWLLYLSLVSVSQVFFNYQWDALLIEVLFMSLFVAPWTKPLKGWRWLRESHQPSYLAITLQRFVLFKLILGSGLLKIWSEDPTWQNFSALHYHYWTQPLPNLMSYWLHKLPEWIHHASCGIMFSIELGTVWLIFLGPRIRGFAFLSQVFLQLMIIATGNFGFFNLLTLALCIIILDDRLLPRWLIRDRYPNLRPGLAPESRLSIRTPQLIRRVCLGMLIAMHIGTLVKQAPYTIPALEPVLESATALRPLRSLNSYGLFANMTESRPEVVLEGSHDGIRWHAYSFSWKPGKLEVPPGWATPHMPRVDWQMWFAALQGNCQSAPWYFRLLENVLSGNPKVLALLDENPFGAEPPRYLRSTLYQYRFTNSSELEATQNYWHRSLPQTFCPIVELVDGQLRSVFQ